MKLDALCRFRAQTEDYVRLELTERDQSLQEATLRHERSQRVADQAAAEYLAESPRGIEVEEVIWRLQAWEAANHEVTGAEGAMRQAHEAREAKQAELMVAIRERKQMDMLVQRRARQLQLRQRRREQREMDDFANGRWALMASRDEWDEGRQCGD